MGLTAKPQGSRAQKSRCGEESNDREQPDSLEPTALLVLREQYQTCQWQRPMNKQDKTPWPRGLAGTDPPPILNPLIPTPTVRTQRPPAPTCLPGKEEKEVVPPERKAAALIVSFNFEQVEYLSKRGCFIKRSEENIKREHKKDFHPSAWK